MVGIGVEVGSSVSVGMGVPRLLDGPFIGEIGCWPGVPSTTVAPGTGGTVGGVRMIVFGSMPGGIIITPGVPSCGGVTMITVCGLPGVDVKVGASARVGTGVSVGRASKSVTEQPTVKMRRTPNATNSENRC